MASIVSSLRSVARREPGRARTIEVIAEDAPVVVRDRTGKLLFEHFPEQGKTVVHVPERDLEIRANGRIDLVAGDTVALSGERAVEIATPMLGVRVDRLVETARIALREATELAESRAGRVRQIAVGAFHIVAERALVRATDALKLRGKKIHLA